MRAHERIAARSVMADAEPFFPHVREVSDPRCMHKDGSKTWWPSRRSLDASDIARLVRK